MNVDFERFLRNLRDSSKMLSHFLRAWADSRKLIQCPAGLRVWGRPRTHFSAKEAPRNARGKGADFTKINTVH
jgi:hypothetical protein